MIITEPIPESPVKSGELSPLIREELSNPPPAYIPNQPYFRYPNTRPELEYRGSPTWRFTKAFCVAIVITTLLSAFASGVVWIANDKAHRSRWYQAIMSSDIQEGRVLSDEPVQYCVEGDNWSRISSPGSSKYPHSARAVFDLPISSDTLYLLAHGSLAHGSATILDSQEGGENVQVEVVASSYTRKSLGHAKVCSLQRRSGENGVGIFTPEHPRHRSKEDQIQFDIVVRIPVQRSHRMVNAFETELPLFIHNVGDIAKTVEFRRLSLRSSSRPMTVTSLHAHHAKLVTSNSPITGSFNSSTSLELRTSNAPINANVGLLNNPARMAATDLIMITSNGRIYSSISLTSSNTTNGLFNVKATTSNQPLELKYDTSPVDSIVYSRAQTSNSPASVSHHSAFEGKIALQSTIFLPSVDKKDVRDPSGQGRHKSFEVLKAAGSVLTGVVYWGTERKEVTGLTQVISTNSQVHLQV